MRTSHPLLIFLIFFNRNLARKISKFALQGIQSHFEKMEMECRYIITKLSGGEQQRIPFAQILVQKPDIVLIDEGTSALDKDSGVKLYQMVFDALPKTAFFSIAHNTHLIPMHKTHLHLEGGRIHEVKPGPKFSQ